MLVQNQVLFALTKLFTYKLCKVDFYSPNYVLVNDTIPLKNDKRKLNEWKL